MTQIIDLHTHTTASDGSMTPEELIRYSAGKGISAVAVTDHDTIDGLERALEEGRKAGLEVIPGVEISVDFKPEMHILGYFKPDTYKNIAGTLARLRKNRDDRNPKIIKKLNELGFDITMEEVRKEALGQIVARPHIASIMVKKGYAESIRDAFDRYLSSGKPAYFKKDKLTPEEGICEIASAGGIPVLAHPIYLYLEPEQLDNLLGILKDAGLKGMEVFYVDNTESDTKALLKLADKHGLIPTGGSDFHGGFKPDIELGTGRGNLAVSYDLLKRLKSLMD